MSILCRLFGHKPSSQVQLNPSTFVEHSYCKRCGVRLVRGGEGGGSWSERAESGKPD